MASTMSKRDILAVSASGIATKKLHQWLQDARNDMVNLAAASTIYHQGIDDGALEGRADAAVTLATAIELANSLRRKIVAHFVSTGQAGAHLIADPTQAIAAPAATDQATCLALVNELATDFDAHLTEAGVHIVNDAANAVGGSDATDLTTLITRVNLVKAKYNLHTAAALTSAYVL
jgi:hypothetical protein